MKLPIYEQVKGAGIKKQQTKASPEAKSAEQGQW